MPAISPLYARSAIPLGPSLGGLRRRFYAFRAVDDVPVNSSG